MHFLVSLALKCCVYGSVNHTRVPSLLMMVKPTIFVQTYAVKFLGFLPHLINAVCVIVGNGCILMFVHKSYSPSKAKFFPLSSFVHKSYSPSRGRTLFWARNGSWVLDPYITVNYDTLSMQFQCISQHVVF